MPKRVRAIVLALIAAAVLAFGAFAFVACDQGGDSGGGKNSPTVSENAATYDVFTGGDYTFKADLKGAEDFTLWMDGSRLGSSQYSYEGGTFTVFAIVMEYLEPDTTSVFRLVTEGGEVEFNVSIVSTSTITMDTDDVVFDYENPVDVVKEANFGEETVDVVRIGSTDYVDEQYYDYSFDEASGKGAFTLKKEFLSTIADSADILVRLTNGDEFLFTVTTNLMLDLDFSDPDNLNPARGSGSFKPVFWGAKVTQSQDEEKWGVVNPQQDHTFVFGTHFWGTMGTVQFKRGHAYELTFDIASPEESIFRSLTIALRQNNDQDPRGAEIMNDAEEHPMSFTLDFTNGYTSYGNTGFVVEDSYDEQTGVAHITVKFVAPEDQDVILNANGGQAYADSYLWSNAANDYKIFWRFDNMLMLDISDEDFEYVYSYKEQTTPEPEPENKTLYSNDFSESAWTEPADAAQTGARTYLHSRNTVALEDGWMKVTSGTETDASSNTNPHILVFGQHTWGLYGGVKFENGKTYRFAFDLKIGDSKTQNLRIAVMPEREEGGSVADPYWATKDLADMFVSFNFTATGVQVDSAASTEGYESAFASTYNSETGVAHVELVFTVAADAEKSRMVYIGYTGRWNCPNGYEWLFDNLTIEEGEFELPEPTPEPEPEPEPENKTLYSNDFSESAWTEPADAETSGVKTYLYANNTAELTDGWLKVTSGKESDGNSTAHIFAFGQHTWGMRGGVAFESGKMYKISFDLKRGDTATDMFRIAVMPERTENGQPASEWWASKGEADRIVDFNFTADGISVIDTGSTEGYEQFFKASYDTETGVAHIELTFTVSADDDARRLVYAGYSGNWNCPNGFEWLFDNLTIEELAEA